MDNTISFKRGQGQRSISDYGDGNQTISFSDDINKHNIRISEHDNAHIILTLIDDNGTETGDSLTLNYAFILEDSAIERLEFANGDVINTADMIAATQTDDISDEAIETPIENASNDDTDSDANAQTINQADTHHDDKTALRLVVNQTARTDSTTSDALTISDSTTLRDTEVSYEELWFGRNSQNHLLNER